MDTECPVIEIECFPDIRSTAEIPCSKLHVASKKVEERDSERLRLKSHAAGYPVHSRYPAAPLNVAKKIEELDYERLRW